MHTQARTLSRTAMTKNGNLSRTRAKLKSSRKPLRDVSNALKSDNISKKTAQENERELGDDSLDRLLLVHSEISSILRQVDELVLQALEVSSKKQMLEIKLFADALTEVKNSVKPWVHRIQKVLSTNLKEPQNKKEQPFEITNVPSTAENQNPVTESPEETEHESLISPSPLVSWRAGGNTHGGRQLFILTPMPQTKKSTLKCPPSFLPASEKAKPEITHEQECISNPGKFGENPGEVLTNMFGDEGLCIELSKQPVPRAHPEEISGTGRPVFLVTPCLKMSPPKSCIVLEPASLSRNTNRGAAYKYTPFRAGGLKTTEESIDSDSSDSLSLRYPELTGRNFVSSKVEALDDSSPNWMLSPPKTCAVLEPTDEPQANSTFLGSTMKLYYNPGLRSNVVHINPMVEIPGSSFSVRVTKHRPGENTLKKELWTKFEAASNSSDPIRFDGSKGSRNEFLDLLNEACDE